MSAQQQIKTDFKPYAVGTVFNPISVDENLINNNFQQVILDYPSRLEAMALDPSKIAENNNLRYTPGQVDFTIKLFKRISVTKCSGPNEVNLSERTQRPVLIRHAVSLMRQALGVKDGLDIDVEDNLNLRHCGLGSSSGLIAGVACAINELYGKPVNKQVLVKYLAQNHGEEIDGDNNLINPVQCIGGSAACGQYKGGVVIIAGESVVVKTGIVSKDYSVVIGVPADFKHPDSKYLMDKEIENLPKFLACGQKYGPTIAYRLFHESLPALEEGNIKPLGNLVFDYRWHMGSIENCSFVYPPIMEMSKDIAFLKEKGHADVLALSSVGPGIFAVTNNPKLCENTFKGVGMNTWRTKVHNGTYLLVNKT